MGQARDILKGTLNNMLKKEEELSKYRMDICKECKLYTVNNVFGPVCNNKLFLNANTNKTSPYPREGYIKGCGCILNSKTRLKGAKCPTSK
jgi:hypothetical protein